MIVENIMYFALGFLAAGLIATAIGPAIWNRAVRLTKRRIAAVTPVTLNEFRADKDKLRAEFAITVRRLEMRIDALREKLAARIVDLDAKNAEIIALSAERDEQYDAIGTLQVREQELVARIRDLERDSAALAAMVRQQDNDGLPLAAMHETPDSTIDAGRLSGDYRSDVEDLLTALSLERQRNGYLEEQARLLLARLEKKKKVSIKDEAIAMLRDTLDADSDPESEARIALRQAEARITNAESRLSALLGEADDESRPASQANGHHLLLAEEFSNEERIAALRADTQAIEETGLADWGSERFDAASLRTQLQALASGVSEAVYAADAEEHAGELEESLFDRVRKFAAADDADPEDLVVAEDDRTGALSERMAALRDMQAR